MTHRFAALAIGVIMTGAIVAPSPGAWMFADTHGTAQADETLTDWFKNRNARKSGQTVAQPARNGAEKPDTLMGLFEEWRDTRKRDTASGERQTASDNVATTVPSDAVDPVKPGMADSDEIATALISDASHVAAFRAYALGTADYESARHALERALQDKNRAAATLREIAADGTPYDGAFAYDSADLTALHNRLRYLRNIDTRYLGKRSVLAYNAETETLSLVLNSEQAHAVDRAERVVDEASEKLASTAWHIERSALTVAAPDEQALSAAAVNFSQRHDGRELHDLAKAQPVVSPYEPLQQADQERVDGPPIPVDGTAVTSGKAGRLTSGPSGQVAALAN